MRVSSCCRHEACSQSSGKKAPLPDVTVEALVENEMGRAELEMGYQARISTECSTVFTRGGAVKCGGPTYRCLTPSLPSVTSVAQWSNGAMHARFMYNAAIGAPLPPPVYRYPSSLLYVIVIRHPNHFPFYTTTITTPLTSHACSRGIYSSRW